MADVYVRFERGQEDRISKSYGPYPFVQLTYDDLRVGPDGEMLAQYAEGFWQIGSETEPGDWSDVIISTLLWEDSDAD